MVFCLALLGRSLLIPFSFMPKKQKSLQKKGFFLWRRERDSSGDTGAVSPPARGTKKPFTGWFFASLCSAVPFSSPSLFIQTKKPTTTHGLFYLVEIRGLEPLASALRTPRYTNLAISPRHKIFYNISARNARVLFWLDGTNFAAGQKNLLFPIDFRPPNKYTIPCPLRRTQLNMAA